MKLQSFDEELYPISSSPTAQKASKPSEKFSPDEELTYMKEPEGWLGALGRNAANVGKEVVKGVVNFPGDVVSFAGKAANKLMDTSGIGSQLGSGNVVTDAIKKVIPQGGILPTTENEYVEKAFKAITPEGYSEPKNNIEKGVVKGLSTALGLMIPVPGGSKVNALRAGTATGMSMAGEWLGKKYDLGPTWTSVLSGAGMLTGLLGGSGFNDAVKKAVEPLSHNPKAAEAMTARFMKEADEAKTVYSWMSKVGDKFSNKIKFKNPAAKWLLGGAGIGLPAIWRTAEHAAGHATWSPELLAAGVGGATVAGTWALANIQSFAKLMTKYPVLRKAHSAVVKSAIKQEIPSFVKNAARFDKEMSKHADEFELEFMPQD